MRTTTPFTAIFLAALLAPLAAAGTLPPPPSATSSVTYTYQSGVAAVPILDLQANPSTIEVADSGHYVWDVNVKLWADHDVSEQLDVRLVSPSGTVVVLSTDFPFDLPDVFFPGEFDDQASYALRSFPADYPGAPLGPVMPEGALSAFVGEDPNGTWTLECADDEAGVQGSYVWEIELTALFGSAVPLPEVFHFEKLDPQPIDSPDLSSEMVLGGFGGGDLVDLDVRVSFVHEAPEDLVISLSDGVNSVPLALRLDKPTDFFLDALFDDDAAQTVADATAPPVAGATPDGALGKWNGLHPAGTWTLRIHRDGTQTGTFYGWEMRVTTAVGREAVTVFCEGESPAPCPCGNHGAPDRGCAGPFGSEGIALGMVSANGFPRLGDDGVRLVAEGLEPFQICLFLQGTQDQAPQPFGDGLLCLAGTLRRLGVRSTGFGETSFPGLFDRPLWETSGVRPPGDTRHYQLVSRSSFLFGPCHTGLATSNSLRAVWLP